MRRFLGGLFLLVLLTGCSRKARTIRSLEDGGLEDSSSSRDSTTADGASTGPAISLNVRANIDWSDDVFFDTQHDLTLWIFDPEAVDTTPALIGSGGKVSSFVLRREGNAWRSTAETRVDFMRAEQRGGCSTQGPINYETLSFTLTPSGGSYTLSGTATGSMRGTGGDVVYASDFSATLSGSTETADPRVQWATERSSFHPLDAFEVFFSEPLDATAVAILTGGSTTLRLTNAGASLDDVGPFNRSFLAEGKMLPWGTTLRLQVDGEDLTGNPIDASPSSVDALSVESDPGLFDEAMGFEAETVNALLLHGAQIIARADLGLEGESHVAFIPTGEVAIGDEETPTNVSGRMTLRIPIAETDNTIRFGLALYVGNFGTPTFTGVVQGILPNSDRRVFFDSGYPSYSRPETGSFTPFMLVQNPIGSRAIDEGELVLDFIAHRDGCGLQPPPITGIIIDHVVVE